MKKIGVFYGSTNGTTADIAKRIGSRIGIDLTDVLNVANISVEKVIPYEVLLLGSSTLDDGILQEDWKNFLPKLKEMDLSGKYVAIFGTGDSVLYSESFCDAIGIIYKELISTNCMFCGAVSIDGYTFEGSIARIRDMFVGLPLDEINESELTDQRIDEWIEQITVECLNKLTGYCMV